MKSLNQERANEARRRDDISPILGQTSLDRHVNDPNELQLALRGGIGEVGREDRKPQVRWTLGGGACREAQKCEFRMKQ